MKKLLLLSIIALSVLIGCKSDKKQEEIESQPDTKLTILEKIANAHGYENWKSVSSIKFTFNVDRDSSHFERTWLWQTGSNDVTMMTSQDTTMYNRKSIDSAMTSIDGGISTYPSLVSPTLAI